MKYYYPDDCFSWREVSSYIKSKIRNNDTIVLSPLQGIAPFWLYYKKDFKNLYLFGNGIGGKGIKVNGEWQSSFLDGDILVYGINMGDVKLFVEKIVSERILMNRTGDFWFIVQDGWIGEKEYRILNDFFNSHFSLIEAKHYPFEGIQLFRFMAKKEVLYE
jgi:hypothetical protein